MVGLIAMVVWPCSMEDRTPRALPSLTHGYAKQTAAMMTPSSASVLPFLRPFDFLEALVVVRVLPEMRGWQEVKLDHNTFLLLAVVVVVSPCPVDVQGVLGCAEWTCRVMTLWSIKLIVCCKQGKVLTVLSPGRFLVDSSCKRDHHQRATV